MPLSGHRNRVSKHSNLRHGLKRWIAGTALLCAMLPMGDAIHHMKRRPVMYVARDAETRPLMVSNHCPEVIYPGIGTQAGTGPEVQGFRLDIGETRNLTVSPGWQGRVWGRTNCSFNADGTGPSNAGGFNGGGQSCRTGDCGGVVDCQLSAMTPVSLAEFTLASASGQAFYDISLVDGYNIPLGIVSLYPESDNSTLTDIPPNLTNPICIGTAALLAELESTADQQLGTNSSFPIPLERTMSSAAVARWCPWDLQLDPPYKPGDGVYPYPDDNIVRPEFDPCYSACAKWNQPEDCCTGSYDSPDACRPSIYSQHAKGVCPDAYSFAFDDQTSTFIVPSGGGFGVIFCPSGRSSNILATLGQELRQLAQTGRLSVEQAKQLQNATYIRQKESKAPRSHEPDQAAMQRLALLLTISILWQVWPAF